MAKVTTVTLLDDLDGSPADEQIDFAIDGKSYEMDLSAVNAAKFRDTIAAYIAAARRGSPGIGKARSSSTTDRGDQPDPREVRAWAHEHGLKVSDRGRVLGSIVTAYKGLVDLDTFKVENPDLVAGGGQQLDDATATETDEQTGTTLSAVPDVTPNADGADKPAKPAGKPRSRKVVATA